jgi:transporter family protein
MPDLIHSWRFFALAAALFAALTAIFGKVGVSTIPSNLATLIRTVVVLLIAAAIVGVRREWQRPDGTLGLPGREMLFLVLSGVATGLSWLCYYRALQLGPASAVAPLDKLSVVLVILFAWLFLGEALTWRTMVGGLLIAAGAILISLAPSPPPPTATP